MLRGVQVLAVRLGNTGRLAWQHFAFQAAGVQTRAVPPGNAASLVRKMRALAPNCRTS